MTKILVPNLPESVADATVITWHKQAGDFVEKNENLLAKSALHILGAPIKLFMKNKVKLCIAETISLIMFQLQTSLLQQKQ